jgi:xanthosine utilization system XapX-like protein
MSLTTLIPTLQLAIGPVILISGVGMILLSMTNRFGRVIDLSRQLARDLSGASDAEREKVLKQVRVLWRRAKIIRAGIALAVISALLAALLIISLFVGAILKFTSPAPPVILFVMCMICLITSLVMFFWEINLSLNALRLEMPSEEYRIR